MLSGPSVGTYQRSELIRNSSGTARPRSSVRIRVNVKMNVFSVLGVVGSDETGKGLGFICSDISTCVGSIRTCVVSLAQESEKRIPFSIRS